MRKYYGQIRRIEVYEDVCIEAYTSTEAEEKAMEWTPGKGDTPDSVYYETDSDWWSEVRLYE